MEVGVDHPPHVARAGTRRTRARPPAGWRPPARRSRRRRCRGTCASSLLPSAGVDQHQAVGMLDQQAAHGERECGGARRARRASSRACRGTTPNMAPPSSRWRPPSSVWQRSRPTVNDCATGSHRPLRAGVRPGRGRHGAAAGRRRAPGPARLDRGEVLQRARALLPGQPQQPAQQLGRDQRVAGGAVPAPVLEAEVAASGCRARRSARPSPAGGRAARCRGGARPAPGPASAAAPR